jgi:hypothetical protein
MKSIFLRKSMNCLAGQGALINSRFPFCLRASLRQPAYHALISSALFLLSDNVKEGLSKWK